VLQQFHVHWPAGEVLEQIDPVEEVGVLYFLQATIPLSGEIRIEERRLGSLKQPQSPG
jgi:hypothetical protein